MSLSRIQARKAETAKDLHEIFARAQTVVVAHYNGISTTELTGLRRALSDKGGHFRVIKNSLALRAIEGTPNACLADFLRGPAAIAWSEGDPIAVPKTITEFRKKNEEMEIIGGASGGETLSAERVAALAALPSEDELRSKLIGLLNAPATRLASLLQAPAANLARLLVLPRTENPENKTET